MIGDDEYFPDSVTLGPNEVIVITGGSGFLGQHIIRCLNERADGIKEIRVVDLVEYKRKLDFKVVHTLKYYKSDITKEDDLDEPFNGATTVIHAAAAMEIGHYVNRDRVLAVNVIGCRNVIFKCRHYNIPKVIYTSSVDALIRHDTVFTNQREEDTILPNYEDQCLMGYYAFTKSQGEAYIICSKNQPMLNGKQMKCAILRPTVLYGELDPFYVSKALKIARFGFGLLPKPTIIVGEPILQSTYVGNAAWAHVLAIAKLNMEWKNEQTLEEFQKLDGKSVFITDDTPPKSWYDFLRPFLKAKNYYTVQLPVPVSIIHLCVWGFNKATSILSDDWKKWLDSKGIFPTVENFQITHSMVHVNRDRATNCLDYCPVYPLEDAMKRSIDFYNKI